MSHRRVIVLKPDESSSSDILTIEASRLCRPDSRMGMGECIRGNLAGLGWWLDSSMYDWEIVIDDAGQKVLIGIKK